MTKFSGQTFFISKKFLLLAMATMCCNVVVQAQEVKIYICTDEVTANTATPQARVIYSGSLTDLTPWGSFSNATGGQMKYIISDQKTFSVWGDTGTLSYAYSPSSSSIDISGAKGSLTTSSFSGSPLKSGSGATVGFYFDKPRLLGLYLPMGYTVNSRISGDYLIDPAIGISDWIVGKSNTLSWSSGSNAITAAVSDNGSQKLESCNVVRQWLGMPPVHASQS